MTELWELTAGQMGELVRKRKVSRVELVQAHLDRIHAVNPTLNALVELCDQQALDQAKAADDDHHQRTDLPLDGVPISIKDHFDVQGMKHTEGLPSMADVRSPSDEEVIRRLRAAGAIIIGKANQPDLQIRWNTISHLYGPTLNPRNLGNTAGGSSGGDAAAVAAGMAPLGLGLDYGGSIRVPATFCEIYGLRPSAGRVPAVPSVPPFDGPPSVDFMASIGPLARCVEDLTTVYQVIAGLDVKDPATVPVQLLQKDASGKLPKIARMVTDTGANVSPEIVARLEKTTQILKDAGYEVTDVAIPHAHRAPELWAQIIGTELMETGMPEFRHLLGDSNRQHIEEMFGEYNFGRDVGRYIGGLTERRKIIRDVAAWMDEHPLVLCPIAGMPTPSIDFDHMLGVKATLELFNKMRNITWVNLLGIPSVALPNGIQIVGRRFHESQVLQAALAAQLVLGTATVATL